MPPTTRNRAKGIVPPPPLAKKKAAAKKVDVRIPKTANVPRAKASAAPALTEEPSTAEKRPEPVIEEEEKAPPAKKAKSGLAVGDQFPDADLDTDETGKKIKLSDVWKDHGIVIFLYPKANTGGCTKQACGFKDNYSLFEEAGYKIFGLSADSPKSQASWKQKYSLQYNLLCDPTFELIKAIGASKGGKSIARSHVVIEKGGKVKDIRISVSPGDSYTGALKTVQE